MFPSVLVRPEVGFWSPALAYAVLALGFILTRFRRALAVVGLAALLFLPLEASAFWIGVNGNACGTACLARNSTYWGPPMLPSRPLYYYPFMPFPSFSYYQNPYAFYPMLPQWGPPCLNCMATAMPVPVAPPTSTR